MESWEVRAKQEIDASLDGVLKYQTSRIEGTQRVAVRMCMSTKVKMTPRHSIPVICYCACMVMLDTHTNTRLCLTGAIQRSVY